MTKQCVTTRISLLAAVALGMTTACSAGEVEADQAQAQAAQPQPMAVKAYAIDAANGRKLFVDKGCVICHAANGVGGTAAHPFDGDRHDGPVDPLAFSARVWRGAPVMVELQSIELGYVIDLNAQDLADLAGFAASAEEQKRFDINDVPENLRSWFLDAMIWEQDGWLEQLRNRINSDDN